MRVDRRDQLLRSDEAALWIQGPNGDESDDSRRNRNECCCRPALLPIDPAFEPVSGLDTRLWIDFVRRLNNVVPLIGSDSVCLDTMQILILCFFILTLVMYFVEEQFLIFFPSVPAVWSLPFVFICTPIVLYIVQMFRCWRDGSRDARIEKICNDQDLRNRFRACGYRINYRYYIASQSLWGDRQARRANDSERQQNRRRKPRIADARVIAFKPLRSNTNTMLLPLEGNLILNVGDAQSTISLEDESEGGAWAA